MPRVKRTEKVRGVVRAPLPPKMAMFLALYLSNGRNAVDAYRRSYSPNNSYGSASRESGRLLANPKIRPFIEEAELKQQMQLAKVGERYAITKGRIMEELALLAFARMDDYTAVTESGDPCCDLSKLSAESWAPIKEISLEEVTKASGEKEVRRIRFKLYDKLQALSDLAKLAGFMIDRHEFGKPGDFSKESDDDLRAAIEAELVASGLDPQAAREMVRIEAPGGEDEA